MFSPIWLLLLLGGATVVSNNVDYATSTPDIAYLLQIEDELIGYMRHYVKELKQKVDRMRKVQEEWKTRQEHVQTDAESNVANPLISFPLVLRMLVDAPKWLELGRQDIQKGPLQQLVDRDLSAVTDLDLQLATRGLMRSQYSMDEMHGKQYDIVQMTKRAAFVDAAVESNTSGHVMRFHRRIEDMTGLELGESEPLMVSNFGIGGQHFIHLDCQQPKHFVEQHRAASVLLYLTEVQIGGYASFPALGFGFKPNLGSALVWHNIDSSGNCDIRSLQATCPVLLGTQWVATKWISGSGQWRRKPCRK